MVVAIIGFLAILFFVGCALCIGAILLCDIFDWGEFDPEDMESEEADSDSVPNLFKAPKEDAIPISPIISSAYKDGQKISDEEYNRLRETQRLRESFQKYFNAELYNPAPKTAPVIGSIVDAEYRTTPHYPELIGIGGKKFSI